MKKVDVEICFWLMSIVNPDKADNASIKKTVNYIQKIRNLIIGN